MLAETARRGVHARRLDVRAQARRLSAHRRQARGEADAASRATATTTPRCFPKSRAPSRRCRSTSCILDGEVVVLDDEGTAELRAAPAARAPSVADRTSSAPRSSCRPRSSRSTFSPSRTSTCARCRLLEAQDAAPGRCSRSSAPCARSTTSSERARRSCAQVERARPRGDHREEGRLALPRGARDDWLKIKAERTGDFVDRRLHGAAREPRPFRRAAARRHGRTERLVYAGRVGTGFDDELLGELIAMLADRPEDAPSWPPAFGGAAPIPDREDTTWVEPALRRARCGIAEWTPDGLLRHPAFLRMRDDKPIRATAIREGRDPAGAGEPRSNRSAGARHAPASAPMRQPDEKRSRSRISRRSTGPPTATPRAT